MDDVLCNRVSRGSLTTEEDSDWTSRDVTSLDVQILVDNVQSVHLLALVLMQALDLDIKDRFYTVGRDKTGKTSGELTICNW